MLQELWKGHYMQYDPMFEMGLYDSPKLRTIAWIRHTLTRFADA
jgi:hypothetical protein